MNSETAQYLCEFPDRLHPISEMILDYYIAGILGTQDFLRFFSLPNSDYIPIAKCFTSLLTVVSPGL
ncbi:MAG: hypothetical protein E2O38_07890 [Proteobacteria bacterium]|nr:MAG: hypothetical protein E2O38_07890 [Pseudomonadota bacterium]